MPFHTTLPTALPLDASLNGKWVSVGSGKNCLLIPITLGFRIKSGIIKSSNKSEEVLMALQLQCLEWAVEMSTIPWDALNAGGIFLFVNCEESVLCWEILRFGMT